jgi:hypothetical protein
MRQFSCVALLSYLFQSYDLNWMSLLRAKKGCVAVLTCFGWMNVAGWVLQADPIPTGDEIMQKAVKRAQQAAKRSSQEGYTYRKVSIIEELDAAGKIKERKEKVYEVSYRGGWGLSRLLEVNGHPPCRTDMKEQTENEANARQALGQPKERQSNPEPNFLTAELVGRFVFTLTGQTNLNGRLAYKLEFRPKNPEPPIHAFLDRLLNRLGGAIWIDAEEYELAQAQLQLNSPVDLLWGVVGSLKKLTFTLTRAPMGDGIWLNTGSIGNFEGRKLLDPLRLNLRTQNSNFRLLP